MNGKGSFMSCRFGNRIAAAGLLGVALCVAVGAQAADTTIYRSVDASGTSVTYSDRPLNKTSHAIAVFDGKQLWPRSGGGPVSAAEIALRRTGCCAIKSLIRADRRGGCPERGLVVARFRVDSALLCGSEITR